MATSPEAVRAQLAIVTAAATTDLSDIASAASRPADAIVNALSLVLPSYYDAAGSLAVAWYDERRDESNPTTSFAPTIVGNPSTDWIEREAEKFAKSLEGDLDAEIQRMTDELLRLTEKEVARGFRDTIRDNTLDDVDAIGWSRVARPGACRLCLMAADKGAVYSKVTAFFAAHTDCHCAARPEFEGGDHGPEATVLQYTAAKKRRTERERKVLRKHLNKTYPDARG